MGPELQRSNASSPRITGLGRRGRRRLRTDALRIGLQALGIRPGDEVLVTANAGYRPWLPWWPPEHNQSFAMWIRRTTRWIPDEIGSARHSRPGPVMVVHLYGHPAPMEAIVEQAPKHG